MSVPIVRRASLDDAAAIAALAGQLGYPATTAEAARRLREVGSNPEHAVLVAEGGVGVVGWIHVRISHLLLADTPAEIAGLVIDERERGRGIGRLLMAHAEDWAAEHGCRSVRLRSNVIRDRAHSFYERLGYRVTKSQRVFAKDLTR